ncbi:MAG: ATP-dependent Clp protease ATP-binding subunit [Lachnospiraceae bacterium]|nr:ATP-dependent Clp protease ATP-binding subunit [Lachnospiraceae bacterium]
MSRKYTEKAWIVLTMARQLSDRFKHGYVGSEHLLLALCMEKSGVAAMVLQANDIDEEKIVKLIDEQIALPGKVAKKEREGFTPKVEAILDLAQELAESFDCDEIGTEHLLLAIITDADNLALRLINTLSVNPQKLFADTLVAMGENLEDYKEQIKAAARHTGGDHQMLIEKYSRDLTALAAEGKLDPVIGRDVEITRMIQTLSRRTKNNPCLIGEPGVGKTAIVEGLAQRIADGEVPDTVAGKRLLTLDLPAMVAGSKYRGEFEERIKRVISEVTSEGNILLFMDEVHTIIGAGGAEGSIDASNILKPSLARGEVLLIGATTYDEYRKHIEKDAALERRFQPIYVEEPSEQDCVEILRGIAPAYEKHHNVKYDDEALVAAAKLSARYISDRFLPDKAIDLIDEAASSVRLGKLADTGEVKKMRRELADIEKTEEECLKENDIKGFSAAKKEAEKLIRAIEKKTGKHRKSDKGTRVTKEDIERIIAALTKIPVERLSESESSKLVRLERELSKSVIGQEEAVSAVARAVKRGRVGLKESGRPIGSFLFLGPTGVGKTELSKTLARELFGTENALIRVDMSEYMEKHTVSKMIGSPPGYVGFEEGGQLSEKVRRNPYSVVLFDEIEKAHPDVFNILLQVLDDGHITDSGGRKVSFKNTIIIMTSNAGANRIIDPKKLGFMTQTDEKSDHERMKSGVMEEVKNTFKPEFINRIDEIVVFRTLNDEDLKKIVTLQTKDLCERCLEARSITLKITDSAKKLVALKGNDKKFGARPIRRAVQTMIEDPLAQEILEGRFKEGDTVTVRAKDDKIIFE